MDTFMASLAKMLGPAGAQKLMQDLGNCMESSRGELRRLRLDLSRNASADAAERMKLSGKSPWRRTTVTRVRPGRTNDYIEAIRSLNAALAKAPQPSRVTTYISQGAGGQAGTVFYTTSLASSLADLAPPTGSLSQLMGEQAYQNYTKRITDSVVFTESYITRVIPELSHPSEEMVSAAPDVWKPKPPPGR
ncbi:MAG: hypothetical protein HY235_23990 [Acidobacteria bacterium]|nr:hypothetical protein [Acidobacteriota bacterium]